MTTPPCSTSHVGASELSRKELWLEEKQAQLLKREVELKDKEEKMAQRERHLAGMCTSTCIVC